MDYARVGPTTLGWPCRENVGRQPGENGSKQRPEVELQVEGNLRPLCRLHGWWRAAMDRAHLAHLLHTTNEFRAFCWLPRKVCVKKHKNRIVLKFFHKMKHHARLCRQVMGPVTATTEDLWLDFCGKIRPVRAELCACFWTVSESWSSQINRSVVLSGLKNSLVWDICWM